MLAHYRKIFDLLTPRERSRFWMLLGLVAVAALFETTSLAGIMPFLAIVMNPGIIETNPVLARINGVLGFEDAMGFASAVGIALFALVLVSVTVRLGALYALTRFGLMRSHSIATRLLAGYLAQPYTWFLTRHPAELSKTVLSEVETSVAGYILPALRFVQAATISAAIVVLLLLVQPWIAVGAFVTIGGAYVLIYLALRQNLHRLGQRRLAVNKIRFRTVHEVMNGAKEVKLMGLEAPFMRRFSTATREMAEIRSKEAVMGHAPRYAVEGVAYGGLIVGILILMHARGGDMEDLIPVLGLIAVSVTRLFPQLQQVYQNLALLRANQANLDFVRGELTAFGSALSAAADPGGPRLHPGRGIALDAVHYAYPGAERTALEGLSLEFPTGEKIGIVGGTGAGKTTVIDLILGLLRPQQGALLVDGEPVTEATLRTWQRSVGYVPQQIYLADRSVAGNIAFGIPEDQIDRAAVERAARIASLHDFVLDELPQGYETMVGDRGLRLSGGQRQRIGIARALYHDPDVLILDEATSALDNLTERAVMEAVHAIGRDKTVIMIAHRLSTVRDCDRIILLERGRKLAEGRYDDLLESSETFRDMASAG